MATIETKPLILLVEDNPSDVTLMVEALNRCESEVRLDVVNDGDQAIDYLFETLPNKREKLAHHPVVVILDLKLPKAGGLEVLQRIREDQRTTTIPVVILTGSSEQEDKLKSYQLGANSYVRKPVDFYKFVEVTRNLGLYWSRLNLIPSASSEF